MIHAPGKRVDNWFTRLMKVVCHRPLCGALRAGDEVATKAGAYDCPACRNLRGGRRGRKRKD